MTGETGEALRRTRQRSRVGTAPATASRRPRDELRTYLRPATDGPTPTSKRGDHGGGGGDDEDAR